MSHKIRITVLDTSESAEKLIATAKGAQLPEGVEVEMVNHPLGRALPPARSSSSDAFIIAYDASDKSSMGEKLMDAIDLCKAQSPDASITLINTHEGPLTPAQSSDVKTFLGVATAFGTVEKPLTDGTAETVIPALQQVTVNALETYTGRLEKDYNSPAAKRDEAGRALESARDLNRSAQARLPAVPALQPAPASGSGTNHYRETVQTLRNEAPSIEQFQTAHQRMRGSGFLARLFTRSRIHEKSTLFDIVNNAFRPKSRTRAVFEQLGWMNKGSTAPGPRCPNDVKELIDGMNAGREFAQQFKTGQRGFRS